MNTAFPDPDFLLESPVARALYHDVAAGLPIIDYHNHLPPREIAENRSFENLTRLWLAGDHYKWRAMRTLGVPERFITGDASDEEKFERWAACVPATLRNPLYHWTHMELQHPFGIHEQLNARSAGRIWARTNELLAQPGYAVHGLLARARVELVCTTDDPADTLEWHRMAARAGTPFLMLPAFRPDAAFAIDCPETWNAWIDRLSAAAGRRIADWDDLLKALEARCDHFHAHGCRLADHGLEQMYADSCAPERADRILRAARNGEAPGGEETRAFRSALLFELGRMYAMRNWTQQFHLGALRNVNTRMEHVLGRDAGFDVIGDFEQARPLARALDRWEADGSLAKTGDLRRVPGRRDPRTHPVWQRMVVPRPARRHAAPFGSAVEPRLVEHVRRDAHRLALIPLLQPPRLFPPPAVLAAGTGRGPRTASARHGVAGRARTRH
jgi:glucuronate isomerase